MANDEKFDAAMNALLDHVGDGVESWRVKSENDEKGEYEVAVYDGDLPGLYRVQGTKVELLEAFDE